MIVCKTSQHSIMQVLIGNEMDSDANIAVHLSLGPKVNGQQNPTSFAEFFFTSFGWITVDMLVISVVEMCFRLGLN